MILVRIDNIRVENLPDIGHIIKRKPNPRVKIRLKLDHGEVERKTNYRFKKRSCGFKESIVFIIPRTDRDLVFEIDVVHRSTMKHILPEYDNIGDTINYTINPSDLSFDHFKNESFHVVNRSRLDSIMYFSIKKARPVGEIDFSDITYIHNDSDIFEDPEELEGEEVIEQQNSDNRPSNQENNEEREDVGIFLSEVQPNSPEVEEELIFASKKSEDDRKNEEKKKVRKDKEEEEENEGEEEMAVIEKKKLDEMEMMLEKIKDEKLCVCCYDFPKDTVLIPCGHLCLCFVCSQKIQNKCPMCRSQVKKVLKVYV